MMFCVDVNTLYDKDSRLNDDESSPVEERRPFTYTSVTLKTDPLSILMKSLCEQTIIPRQEVLREGAL